ncbi:MAG: CRTAC1 family protein [Verrucomicrobiales bacterium]|nr:MAG: CRTAC1 family protein [Verrucomicrobiaceae bacterium]
MPLGNSGIGPGLDGSDPARQLQEYVRRGASFSGSESHVIFNNEEGSFKNVSSITGLDSKDDGRSVCLTDWDLDGDLDIWISNRSGPQIRFFQNSNPSSGQGINIHLSGKSCNRDAIGARVILKARDNLPQTRTVTAGSGFLAQSSKTLHFGLAKEDVIEEIEIFWPGNEAQIISNVVPGNYYIEQGSEPIDLKVRSKEIVKDPSPFKETFKDRTFLSQRLPLTALFERPPEAKEKPLLICLTVEDCKVCAAQKQEWKLSPPKNVHLQLISESNLALSDPEKLRLIQLTYDHFFDISERKIPTPISFLIDQKNRLCAIYRGHIDQNVLLEDCVNIHIEGTQLRSRSVPFSGLWASKQISSARPLNFVEDLLDAGLLDSAANYINKEVNSLKKDELFPMLLKRLEALKSDRSVP